MLYRLSFYYLIIFSALLLFSACEEDVENMGNNPDQNAEAPSDGSIGTGTFDCTNFSYADTIFFRQVQTGDYIVSPQNSLMGKFGASPEGLVIDSLRGDINVTLSESGLKYEVFFTPDNSSDTCRTSLIISGVDYESKVHLIEQNDTLSVPIYNASRLAALPCSDDDDDDDDDNDCDFEVDENAEELGVEIDDDDGTIDLRSSVINGAFGETPVNGDSLDVTVTYELDDASNGAPNSITIRLFYFEDEIGVPQDLLDEVDSRSIQYDEGARMSKNLKNARTLTGGGRRGGRPPYILIVGRAI